MAQRPPKKSAGCADFGKEARNPKLKPGFDTPHRLQNFGIPQAGLGFCTAIVLLPAAGTWPGRGCVSVVSAIMGTAERVPLPDVVVRAAIQGLCSRTATRLAALDAVDDAAFAGRMMLRPITGDAASIDIRNVELPASFFAQVLGPNRKYSSCFYKTDATPLQEAEEEALRQTVAHASLADGQTILELGCGWGSLSLWIARQFPHAKVTAVSSSQSQRAYVEEIARQRGLLNLRVVTSDMNVFAPEGQYDRIVSARCSST